MSVQKLNAFSLTMIVIGLVIGMGIFRTASDAAKASITPEVFFTAWILGGLVALCGALTYAEIGSRYPITGGYYKVFSCAYHPSIAFALNCVIIISNSASLAGVALIGSDYLASVVAPGGMTDVGKSFIAITAILLFYGVNLLGLKMSSTTQNVLMLIKISLLLLIISSVFLLVPSLQSNHDSVAPVKSIDFLQSLGLALVAICFTYGGYQQTINFGEEVDNAKRTVPRGIVTGILIVISLYLMTNYAYYKVIGFDQLKEARGIASIIGEKLFGPIGKTIFSLLLFTAVLAYVNVLLLSNPRVMYAMADDQILPPIFKKKYGSHEVLTVSLTAFTVLTIIILFYANTFDRILGFVMFLDSIGMVSSAAALFYLRRKTQHLNETGIYQMKWFPLPTLFFIVAYLFVSGSILFNTPMMALIGTVVFVVFLILYFVIRKSRQIAN